MLSQTSNLKHEVLVDTTLPYHLLQHSNENVVLFGCGTFASVSAADGPADVNWVADGAITLTTELLNGRNTLVVLTPCNVLNIPMDVTADYLMPVEITGTLRGCDGERTAQQRWVEQLFSGVVSWSKDGNELTLLRDDRSVTLTSS